MPPMISSTIRGSTARPTKPPPATIGAVLPLGTTPAAAAAADRRTTAVVGAAATGRGLAWMEARITSGSGLVP